MEYSFWLLISAGLPLLLLWGMWYRLLWKYKSTLITIVILSLLIHVPWDMYAVRTGIWSFPTEKNLGFLIFNLPIEEFLFSITIPLIAASITLIVKYNYKK